MQTAWLEFKTTLLPFLIAAAVVAVVMYTSQRTEAVLRDELAAMRVLSAQQAEEVGKMRDLLSQQGYTLAPFDN